MKIVKMALESFSEKYWWNISVVATNAFYQYVKPYLDKHGMSFLAGSGYWAINGICSAGVSVEEMDEELGVACDTDFQNLYAVCSLEVDGHPQGDLGSLMPN